MSPLAGWGDDHSSLVDDSSPMTRLSLEMAESVCKQLEHICDQTLADSLAEVIRRVLAVYDIPRKTTAEGGVIVLQTTGFAFLIWDYPLTPSKIVGCWPRTAYLGGSTGPLMADILRIRRALMGFMCKAQTTIGEQQFVFPEFAPLDDKPTH